MKHFEGSNTAMNIHYKADGKTWEEIYNELVDKRVMHWDSFENYVLSKQEIDQEDFWNEDNDYDQESYEKAVYGYPMTDDEYLDVMASDNGNAYYQSYYKNDEDYRNGVTI